MDSSHFVCSLIEITRTLPKFECNFSFGHQMLQQAMDYIENETKTANAPAKIKMKLYHNQKFLPFENRKQETIISVTVRKAISLNIKIYVVVTS